MTQYLVQVDSANKLETGDVKNRDCDSGDYNQPLSDVSSMVRIICSRITMFMYTIILDHASR